MGSDLVCDRDWHSLCGISDTGAILVRPVDDTHIDAHLDSAIAAAHGHAA
ncbi:hypothetical protein ABT030_46995 [Streptomyces mirabilis]